MALPFLLLSPHIWYRSFQAKAYTYWYYTEMSTFLSILSVIITESGASKCHVTIIMLQFFGVETTEYMEGE